MSGALQPLTTPFASSLFNQVQTSIDQCFREADAEFRSHLESSFILWMQAADAIKKEIKLPIHIRFHCHQMMAKSIEETLAFRANTVTVFALSTACRMPVMTSLWICYESSAFSFQWLRLDPIAPPWLSAKSGWLLFSEGNRSSQSLSRWTCLVCLVTLIVQCRTTIFVWEAFNGTASLRRRSRRLITIHSHAKPTIDRSWHLVSTVRFLPNGTKLILKNLS